MKNTKKSGIVRFLYIKNNKDIIGVCLDFDIIEEGSDFKKVEKDLKTAASLHLETVIKNKLPEKLLNRHAPKEYWDLYEKLQSADIKTERKQVPTSSSTNSYKKGEAMIPVFAS